MKFFVQPLFVFSNLPLLPVPGVTRQRAGIDKENTNLNWQTIWGWCCSGISPWGKSKSYTEWEGSILASFMGWMFQGASTWSTSCWDQGCSPSKWCLPIMLFPKDLKENISQSCVRSIIAFLGQIEFNMHETVSDKGQLAFPFYEDNLD